MRLLTRVFILLVIIYFMPEIAAESQIFKKILLKEEPATTATPKQTQNITKKDLEKFTAFEPNNHAEIQPKNHLAEDENASSNEDISRHSEMNYNKSEPLKNYLNSSNLEQRSSESSIETNEEIKSPRKCRKNGKNKSTAHVKLPIIAWPALVMRNNQKNDIEQSENPIRNNSKEPNEMQTQILETVFIPDVHYAANIPHFHGALENHDLTSLLDDKLKINDATHNPPLSTLLPYNTHFSAAHISTYPQNFYKNTANSITISSPGSLFSNYPYRPSGYKLHYYYPHPHHRGYGYHRYKHNGGRLPLPAHGYGYGRYGGGFGRRPTVVYMYPYYPPAKEKVPIVGFSDWREKPIKEEIEGDIMYDFRTNTHSIN